MGSVEENYNALQDALKGIYGGWAGTPEGRPGGPGGRDLFGDPLIESLKRKEEEMNARGWLNSQSPEGEIPYGGIPQGRLQNINFDSLLDDFGGNEGQLEAEIFLKNVPPGVTTDADGDGFDNFRVNRTKQLDQVGI
jgi:hypothetical protein